jgi:cyanate permease
MALLIIGVAALGFNLRGPITSLPPVTWWRAPAR